MVTKAQKASHKTCCIKFNLKKSGKLYKKV